MKRKGWRYFDDPSSEFEKRNCSMSNDDYVVADSEMDFIPVESDEDEEEKFESTVSLSPEQQRVVDLVAQRKNVFFTGSGGTGKSFVLKCIIKQLKKKYSTHPFEGFHRHVAVTAATGIAALAIKGSTIHSVTGVGIATKKQHFGRMFNLKNIWRRLEVLIVDEISMISAEWLECLENTLCELRKSHQPFGGLQIIFAGDFYQLLPPGYDKLPEKKNLNGTTTEDDKDKFTDQGLAFEASSWKKANFAVVILKTVYRQRGRESFINLLEDVRTGMNPAAISEIVKKCSRELKCDVGIKPTLLFARKKEVNNVNERELNKLPDEEFCFTSTDVYTSIGEPEEVNNNRILACHPFWSECPAESSIKLKVGAQVMVLRNMKAGGGNNRMTLVNGSRGIVCGWSSIQQSREEIKVSGLSRAQKVKLLENCGIQIIPRVKFLEDISEELDIFPMEFTQEVAGVGHCSRLQVPLKLAWAITIHKCQEYKGQNIVVMYRVWTKINQTQQIPILLHFQDFAMLSST